MNNVRWMLVSVLSLAVLGGCALSRADQLERKSDRVAASLKSEQQRVLALNSAERTQRLDHLNMLRATLSAANVGLGAIPHFTQPAERDLAYDVIEEVYDTIEWNIPLGPGDPQRPLPSQFTGGVLKLK